MSKPNKQVSKTPKPQKPPKNPEPIQVVETYRPIRENYPSTRHMKTTADVQKIFEAQDEEDPDLNSSIQIKRPISSGEAPPPKASKTSEHMSTPSTSRKHNKKQEDEIPDLTPNLIGAGIIRNEDKDLIPDGVLTGSNAQEQINIVVAQINAMLRSKGVAYQFDAIGTKVKLREEELHRHFMEMGIDSHSTSPNPQAIEEEEHSKLDVVISMKSLMGNGSLSVSVSFSTPPDWSTKSHSDKVQYALTQKKAFARYKYSHDWEHAKLISKNQQ